MKKMALILAAGALSLPLLASPSPMKPGLWRVTIEGPQGARTSDHCISKEEAAKLEPPKGRSADCKVNSFNVSGSTVTWKMSCPSEKMSMESKTTYQGDSFTGVTHIKMGDREMTQKSSGKFLGACPKPK